MKTFGQRKIYFNRPKLPNLPNGSFGLFRLFWIGRQPYYRLTFLSKAKPIHLWTDNKTTSTVQNFLRRFNP